MDFGIASVAGITVICYLIGNIVKNTPLPDRWIPSIAGVSGGLLGLAGLYVMVDFPATEPLTAIAVGIASGLASTGVHQMSKQLRKEESNESD